MSVIQYDTTQEWSQNTDEYRELAGPPSSYFDNEWHSCWIRKNSHLISLGGHHQCHLIFWDVNEETSINNYWCTIDGSVLNPKIPVFSDNMDIIIVLEPITRTQRYFPFDKNRNEATPDDDTNPKFPYPYNISGQMPDLPFDSFNGRKRPGGLHFDEDNNIIYYIYGDSWYEGILIMERETTTTPTPDTTAEVTSTSINIQFSYTIPKANQTILSIIIVNIINNITNNDNCISINETKYSGTNLSISICDDLYSNPQLIAYIYDNLARDIISNPNSPILSTEDIISLNIINTKIDSEIIDINMNTTMNHIEDGKEMRSNDIVRIIIACSFGLCVIIFVATYLLYRSRNKAQKSQQNIQSISDNINNTNGATSHTSHEGLSVNTTNFDKDEELYAQVEIASMDSKSTAGSPTANGITQDNGAIFNDEESDNEELYDQRSSEVTKGDV